MNISSLQSFFSNPINALATAVILLVLWYLYRRYEGFMDSDQSHQTQAHLVLFYLPTCGFCKEMMPEWDKFQRNHEETAKKIDCSQHPDAAEKNGVNGFPTVIKFSDGKKEVFEGERTAEAFESFLKK